MAMVPKRVCEKEGIERFRKPIGCTLDDPEARRPVKDFGRVVPLLVLHCDDRDQRAHQSGLFDRSACEA